MKNLFISILIIFGLISCKDQEKQFRNNYALPLVNNLQVDGNPDDWQNQGLVIPLVANLWGEMNPESFSAKVSLAWDDTYLYLLAEVKDDSLYQDNTGPTWRNDGFEIFLSAQKSSGQIIQYLVAPALTDAFPEAKVEKQNLGNPGNSHLIPDLLNKSQVNDNGYIVEMGIPFAAIDISPSKGDTIALNFYIGDSDGSSKHAKYSWHYNDNAYLNKDALYPVVLSGKGQHYNVLARASFIDTVQYNVQLFSKLPFDGEIRLKNGENPIATGNLQQNNDLHIAGLSFDKSDVTHPDQPLEVYFGDTHVTTIEWLDIPRRYVNIPGPRRFENEILLFEKEDARSFPPRGATLFIGSSSIRLWKTLSEDIPGITYINRGFGGSQTDDVLYYFDRIVAPYHPAKIVYFTGTNDLASGCTPEETVANVEEFIIRVNNLFSETEIYILSNTIAVSRKHLHLSYHEANRQLISMLENYDNAFYVDVTSPGLQLKGQPRPEIYTSDSLHLNRIGYEMWGDILRPLLLDDK